MASKQKLLSKKNTCRVQLTNVGHAPTVSVQSNVEPMPINATQPLDRPITHILQEVAYRQIAGCTNKYTVPQFNTTIRRKNEIASLNLLRPAPQNDLTPRSKATIAPKITQKMNFAADCTVFNDLVPLNVNDSVIKPVKHNATKKPRPFTDKRILPEPELAEYVEPIEHLSLTIPEPELQFEFPEENYNFLEVYKKVYNCN